jgi:ubiquitin-conjugating enzyme E2 L3
MSGSKRIRLELEEVREALTNFKQFRNLEVNELNILNWEGLIVPENEPYKFGAFKVEINFPSKYQIQNTVKYTKIKSSIF